MEPLSRLSNLRFMRGKISDESQNRPWSCGIGDPGTGKSHAAEPHAEIASEVCREQSLYAAGHPDHNNHIVMTRTYTGFESKIRQTRGYGLKLSGEGAEYLCATYPTTGKFDGDASLVFDKQMDAAYDKRTRKSGERDPVTFTHTTNIQSGLIIPDPVWSS